MKKFFLLVILTSSIFQTIVSFPFFYFGRQENNVEPLFHACAKGDAAQVTKLLQKKTNPNCTNTHGTTALHIAAYHGHTAIVTLLLDAGADVNLATKNNKDFPLRLFNNTQGGSTPLMLACARGHIAIVKQLLAHDATINLQDQAGQTALTYCILTNPIWPDAQLDDIHKEIVLMLMDHGANPSIADIHDLTPLYYYRCILETDCNKSRPRISLDQRIAQDPTYQKLLKGSAKIVT